MSDSVVVTSLYGKPWEFRRSELPSTRSYIYTATWSQFLVSEVQTHDIGSEADLTEDELINRLVAEGTCSHHISPR